jgi:hypothetical protein
MGWWEKFKRAQTAEAKEKRKLERANRIIDKLLIKRGKAELRATQLEIEGKLLKAKAGKENARASYQEAKNRRKTAERKAWEEKKRKLGAVAGFFGLSFADDKKKSRGRR